MIGTLYVITNKINNMQYVGKTYKTLEERFKEHIKESQRERGKDRDLYKAFNTFGYENFEIKEIGKFEQDLLEEKEVEYIKKLNTYKNGYNQTLGGDGKRHIQIPDEEFIKLYYELGSVRKVAKHTGHDNGWISKILKRNNVNILYSGVRPIMIEQNNMEFNTVRECAEWLIENNYTLTKSVGGVAKCIRGVLNGATKQYMGFTFREIKKNS